MSYEGTLVIIILLIILVVIIMFKYNFPSNGDEMITKTIDVFNTIDKIYDSMVGYEEDKANAIVELFDTIDPLITDYEINHNLAKVEQYMLNKPEKAKEHLEKAIENMRQRNTYIPQIIDQYEDLIIGQNNIQNGVEPLRNTAIRYPELHNTLNDINELHRALEYNEALENKGEKYFEQKIRWNNDAQNVHDRQVNDDIINSYNKIIKYNNKEYTGTYTTPETSYSEFRKYVLTKDPLIKRVIENIDQDIPYSHFGQGEKRIFGNIWMRINSKDNEMNQENLKKALMDALKHCKTTSGESICSTGRVSNVLQIFTGMDIDDSIGRLMTKEILRNEVFAKCAKIVKDITNEEEQKKEIERVLRSDYSNIINKDELDRLINECLLAI